MPGAAAADRLLGRLEQLEARDRSEQRARRVADPLRVARGGRSPGRRRAAAAGGARRAARLGEQLGDVDDPARSRGRASFRCEPQPAVSLTTSRSPRRSRRVAAARARRSCARGSRPPRAGRRGGASAPQQPWPRGATTSQPSAASTRAVAAFTSPKTTLWTQPCSSPTAAAPLAAAGVSSRRPLARRASGGASCGERRSRAGQRQPGRAAPARARRRSRRGCGNTREDERRAAAARRAARSDAPRSTRRGSARSAGRTGRPTGTRSRRPCSRGSGRSARRRSRSASIVPSTSPPSARSARAASPSPPARAAVGRARRQAEAAVDAVGDQLRLHTSTPRVERGAHALGERRPVAGRPLRTYAMPRRANDGGVEPVEAVERDAHAGGRLAGAQLVPDVGLLARRRAPGGRDLRLDRRAARPRTARASSPGQSTSSALGASVERAQARRCGLRAASVAAARQRRASRDASGQRVQPQARPRDQAEPPRASRRRACRGRSRRRSSRPCRPSSRPCPSREHDRHADHEVAHRPVAVAPRPGQVAGDARADRRVAGRVEREHLPVLGEPRRAAPRAGCRPRRSHVRSPGLVLEHPVEPRSSRESSSPIRRARTVRRTQRRRLGDGRDLRDARQARLLQRVRAVRARAPRRTAAASGRPCPGSRARPGRTRAAAAASPRGRPRRRAAASSTPCRRRRRARR